MESHRLLTPITLSAKHLTAASLHSGLKLIQLHQLLSGECCNCKTQTYFMQCISKKNPKNSDATIQADLRNNASH